MATALCVSLLQSFPDPFKPKLEPTQVSLERYGDDCWLVLVLATLALYQWGIGISILCVCVRFFFPGGKVYGLLGFMGFWIYASGSK